MKLIERHRLARKVLSHKPKSERYCRPLPPKCGGLFISMMATDTECREVERALSYMRVVGGRGYGVSRSLMSFSSEDYQSNSTVYATPDLGQKKSSAILSNASGGIRCLGFHPI
jgi:hypothetical protein